MRVIIAGSRKGIREVEVYNAIRESGFGITTVISGGAPGVDRIGELWAERHNVPVEVYLAEWDVYGKQAGPMRNRRMAEVGEGLIAVMLAPETPGTKNMIEEARSLKLKIYVKLIPGDL